ncbi:MAG: DUF2817 domain-containing protein [Pirellulaceae bacterium]|nr:DUF2817 domain-containing protein [Pirellulaceae bacterium]
MRFPQFTCNVSYLLLAMAVIFSDVQNLCAQVVAPPVTLKEGVKTVATDLVTECEASGFTKYTPYENMVSFMEEVQKRSTEMKLASYGKSAAGRDLPYAIFSRPAINQPWEALVSGKPIVVCNANVHGGEKTYRESCLLLLRDLATPGTDANKLLDDLVILVIPSLNPDGFVRNTRGNEWGIDMNRDYMKLEQKALSNLVQNIHHTWHPHLIIDGHNGGSAPYNLCYQAASHAASDLQLTAICDHGIFLAINEEMEKNGYKSFYYSNGSKESWKGGGFEPRISRNYSSMANSIGILFESPPAGQNIEVAVKSGVIGYQAVLEYTAKNSDQVIQVVNNARRDTTKMGMYPKGRSVVVQMKYEAEDFPVTYEVREDGKYITIKDGKIIKKPVATKVRPRPYAYILPPQAKAAIEMLSRHKISVEQLREPVTVDVSAYTLSDIVYQSEYDHAAAVNVKVGKVIQQTKTFPAGSFVVYTSQSMGRVVCHMLEPESNDNVIHWNTMDALLPKSQIERNKEASSKQGSANPRQNRRQDSEPVIPIFKVMERTPLPTKIMTIYG